MKDLNLTIIVITTLICITILETVALCNHIDGIVLGSVVSIFGVFIGAAGMSIFVHKK